MIFRNKNTKLAKELLEKELRSREEQDRQRLLEKDLIDVLAGRIDHACWHMAHFQPGTFRESLKKMIREELKSEREAQK